jgi:Fur family ferric uptake transcriptional regulator
VYENIFVKHGYKNTKPRQAISDILENTGVPVSAEDIYNSLVKKAIKINLSTVYRSLELLESFGVVNKTVISDGRALFELTKDHHTHQMICTKCNKMIPVELCPLTDIQKQIEKSTEFQVTGHRIEIFGICSECRK